MHSKMECIIVDDEPLARKGMEKFAREMPVLELKASFGNPMEAIECIKAERVDLLFLDIQMPKITGIDLLKSVKPLPITIITSAFPDYALLSYELDVVDYLVKPIPFERFVKAVNKARDFYELRQLKNTDKAPEFIFVKCDNRFEKVLFDDILYVEAMRNYVVIHLAGRKLISYLTMKNMEDNLPADRFLKINKSQILPLTKIDSISGNEIKLAGHSFVISRANKDQVLERIFNGQLLKRK